MISMLRFVSVLLLGGVVQGSGACTTVNGISGACNLPLNYFTFAGSHNSGAGAYGLLYWYSGAVAPSCSVRNQDQSITQQLELGIRYFDFDLAHLDASSGSWWEEGLVLVHCNEQIGCAYSRSFRRAMTEIEDFLGDNRNEIVVVRLKDHPESSRQYIRTHLASELAHFSSYSAKVKINPNANPKLGDAIRSNKRLVVQVNGGFWPRSPLTELKQVESFRGTGGSAYCYSVKDIVDVLLADYRSSDDSYPVQVDWYLNAGLCIYDLAGLCDGMVLHRLVDINKEMVRATHRPISLVMVDYVGRGTVRLADVVREINEYNVQMFS